MPELIAGWYLQFQHRAKAALATLLQRPCCLSVRSFSVFSIISMGNDSRVRIRLLVCARFHMCILVIRFSVLVKVIKALILVQVFIHIYFIHTQLVKVSALVKV